MKNKLTDLNNILFEQLERLNDEDLTGDNLTQEISRAKAITEVSKNIIDNANVQLGALKIANECSFNKVATKNVCTQLLGNNLKEED